MGLTAYNDTIIVSRIDDELSILALLQNIYASDHESDFTLLNVYKELPITAGATIVDIKARTVEFSTSQTQLAAISECGEVLIQSNYMNTSVIGKPKGIDTKRMTVTIGDFAYAEVHADKRNAVRVRLKKPMNVNLEADNNTISGIIRDVSIGGVCVSTLIGSVLENASNIVLIIKLLHGTTGELLETRIPSRIVRIDKSGVQYDCAMVFQHTAASEQILSTFIYQRQLEIIKELKEKLF